MAEPQWLEPTPVEPLSGEEPFKGIDATVIDFWKWGFSDLRTNIVRGILAEFLVARAVGDQTDVRVAWANFDVTMEAGIPVEVKSSGYCQSWKQRRLSQLSFGKLTGRWTSEDGELGAEPEVRADVFVFAVQTCRDCAQYDALDIAQWEFWVVPATAIRDHGGRSVGIDFVRRTAGHAVDWPQLRDAVLAAAS
jgi:hypothetical protein